MSENMNIHQGGGSCCNGGGCGCGMGGGNCGCGCGGRNYGLSCTYKHYFLRWFLGLLIILGVFCVGLNIGEMKGRFEGSRSYGHQMISPMMYSGMPVFIQEDTTDSIVVPEN